MNMIISSKNMMAKKIKTVFLYPGLSKVFPSSGHSKRNEKIRAKLLFCLLQSVPFGLVLVQNIKKFREILGISVVGGT